MFDNFLGLFLTEAGIAVVKDIHFWGPLLGLSFIIAVGFLLFIYMYN